MPDGLDLSQLAVVAMAGDGRPIGVLVVADKARGDCTDADVARLQSLAGPAALVMNQMARYDAAQEMSQKMAELAQLKSDFVSVVSHELRSPITSIIGSLRTLMRPEIDPDSETARELIATAVRPGDRLPALTADLLVAPRPAPEPLPVCVAGLEARPEADTLVRIFASFANQTRAEVCRTCAGAQFSRFKEELTALAVAELAPITAELRRLLAEPGYLDGVLEAGAERARAQAEPVLREIKDIVGLLHA